MSRFRAQHYQYMPPNSTAAGLNFYSETQNQYVTSQTTRAAVVPANSAPAAENPGPSQAKQPDGSVVSLANINVTQNNIKVEIKADNPQSSAATYFNQTPQNGYNISGAPTAYNIRPRGNSAASYQELGIVTNPIEQSAAPQSTYSNSPNYMMATDSDFPNQGHQRSAYDTGAALIRSNTAQLPKTIRAVDGHKFVQNSLPQPLDLTRANQLVAQGDFFDSPSFRESLDPTANESMVALNNLEPRREEEMPVGKTLIDLNRNPGQHEGKALYTNSPQHADAYTTYLAYIQYCRQFQPHDLTHAHGFNNLELPNTLYNLNNYQQGPQNNNYVSNSIGNLRNFRSPFDMSPMQAPSLNQQYAVTSSNGNLYPSISYMYSSAPPAYSLQYSHHAYPASSSNAHPGQNFNTNPIPTSQPMNYFSSMAKNAFPMNMNNPLVLSEKTPKTRGPAKRKNAKPPVPPPLGPDGKPQKRSRTTFTPRQTSALEVEFSKSQYCTQAGRDALAASLNLTDVQVKVWFQNRRTREKKNNPGNVCSKPRQGQYGNRRNFTGAHSLKNEVLEGIKEIDLTIPTPPQRRSSSAIPETPEPIIGQHNTISRNKQFTQNQIPSIQRGNPTPSFVYNSNLNNGGSYTVNLGAPNQMRNEIWFPQTDAVRKISSSSSPEIIESSFDNSFMALNQMAQNPFLGMKEASAGNAFPNSSLGFSEKYREPDTNPPNLNPTTYKPQDLQQQTKTGYSNFPELRNFFGTPDVNPMEVNEDLCRTLLPQQREDVTPESSSEMQEQGFSELEKPHYHGSPNGVHFSLPRETGMISEMNKTQADMGQYLHQNNIPYNKDYSLQSMEQMVEQCKPASEDFEARDPSSNTSFQYKNMDGDKYVLHEMSPSMTPAQRECRDLGQQALPHYNNFYQNENALLVRNTDDRQPDYMELNAATETPQASSVKSEPYDIFESETTGTSAQEMKYAMECTMNSAEAILTSESGSHPITAESAVRKLNYFRNTNRTPPEELEVSRRNSVEHETPSILAAFNSGTPKYLSVTIKEEPEDDFEITKPAETNFPKPVCSSSSFQAPTSQNKYQCSTSYPAPSLPGGYNHMFPGDGGQLYASNANYQDAKSVEPANGLLIRC